MKHKIGKLVLGLGLILNINLAVKAHAGHEHETSTEITTENLVGTWTVTQTTTSQSKKEVKFHAGHSHETTTTLLKLSFCLDDSDNFYGTAVNKGFIEGVPEALEVASIEDGDTAGTYTLHLSSSEEELTEELHLDLTLNNATRKARKQTLTVQEHGGEPFTAKPKLPLKATRACLNLIPAE